MISRIKKNIDALLISAYIITLTVVSKIMYKRGAFDSLVLPRAYPSEHVFNIAWLAAYLLTAFAAITLVRAYKHIGYYKVILGYFMVVVLLKTLWSYLFFIEQNITATLVTAIVTAFTVLTIIAYTWQDAKRIALLLVPVALWMFFVIYLDYSLLILN